MLDNPIAQDIADVTEGTAAFGIVELISVSSIPTLGEMEGVIKAIAQLAIAISILYKVISNHRLKKAKNRAENAQSNKENELE